MTEDPRKTPQDPEQQEEFAAGLHRIDEAGRLVEDDKAEIAADDAGASALAQQIAELPPD
ncbi:MAG: hypothetical protein INF91_10470 [Alphaproteobacteria bacterium]|nr:hypothetical protein [Alphaproteobacteria bacterium]